MEYTKKKGQLKDIMLILLFFSIGNYAWTKTESEHPHCLHTWVMKIVLEYMLSHFGDASGLNCGAFEFVVLQRKRRNIRTSASQAMMSGIIAPSHPPQHIR